MKHLFLAFIAVLLSICSSYCQEKTFPLVEIGLAVRIQSPKFLNDHIIDYLTPKDFHVRPAVGLLARYYPIKHFFVEFQSDLSFEGGGFDTRKTNLNYFKNTIALGHTGNPNSTNIVYFGPTYSFNILLGAKSKNEIENTNESISSYYKNLYHGFGLILGYKHRFKDGSSLGATFGSQLYSSNINKSEPLKTRQLLLPTIQFSFAKKIMNNEE